MMSQETAEAVFNQSIRILAENGFTLQIRETRINGGNPNIEIMVVPQLITNNNTPPEEMNVITTDNAIVEESIEKKE